MPRKKQDETPLLARVQQAITADDYGKARAEEFIANLVAGVRFKWPIAPPTPAKGKGGAATSITRTRKTQGSGGGGGTLANPPVMSSAKAAEGGNGGVPLPYAPPPEVA